MYSRKQANTLNKGDYIMHKDEPFRIMEKVHVKIGKHGPGKEVMNLVTVFGDRKTTKVSFGSNKKLKIPDYTNETLFVSDIDDEGYITALDMDSVEVLFQVEDKETLEKIEDALDSAEMDEEVCVKVFEAAGRKKIKEVKVVKETT